MPLFRCSFFSLLLLISPALAGKTLQKRSYTQEQVLQLIDDHKIQFIEFAFTDLLGDLRSVTVPYNHGADALTSGLYFDGSSIPGYSRIFESDMLLVPDLTSLTVLPWLGDGNRTLRIMCSVHKSRNEKYDGDPRNLLANIMQEARAMGYEFLTGSEKEFFLFTQTEKGLTTCDKQRYCDATRTIKQQQELLTLMHMLERSGVDAEKLHHEVAPGQLEFSIRYNNALAAADTIITARHTVKTVANTLGYHATFMPKPIKGENGSGMHIHFSLFDIAHNKNAFYDPNGPAQLSEIAQQFIAGVLNRIIELNILFNQTVNSYKRLVPGYEAPVYVCWGTRNRSALVRIPAVEEGASAAVRAELRSPDSLCNPYLALAALLKAGLEGIKNKETLQPAIETNLFSLSPAEITERGIKHLPTSLEQALAIFEQSKFAQQLLGSTLFNHFVNVKKKELKEFNTIVTEWELEKYR